MAPYLTKIRDESLKVKLKRKLKKSKRQAEKIKVGNDGFELGAEGKCPRRCFMLRKYDEYGYWNILYFIPIQIFVILMYSSLILVPQHDAIKESKYWYEVFIAAQFSFSLSITFYRMIECKILFQLDSFISLKSFLIMYFTLAISIFLWTFIYFFGFVIVLSYDPPMPLDLKKKIQIW